MAILWKLEYFIDILGPSQALKPYITLGRHLTAISHSADGTELNDKSASPGTRFSGIEVRDLLVPHLKNSFDIQL